MKLTLGGIQVEHLDGAAGRARRHHLLVRVKGDALHGALVARQALRGRIPGARGKHTKLCGLVLLPACCEAPEKQARAASGRPLSAAVCRRCKHPHQRARLGANGPQVDELVVPARDDDAGGLAANAGAVDGGRVRLELLCAGASQARARRCALAHRPRASPLWVLQPNAGQLRGHGSMRPLCAKRRRRVRRCGPHCQQRASAALPHSRIL